MSEMLRKFQEKIKDNIILWVLIFGLNTISIATESLVPPATRPFSLTDVSISYPFTEAETYTTLWLGIVVIVFPTTLFLGLIILDNKPTKFQRFYKAISGLLFGVGVSMFITTFLKVRMAKLRPDFLARCVPILKKGESSTGLFTQEICSAPFGRTILLDGYRSNPSGHSSLAFSTMLFLSMWLLDVYGQKSNSGLMKITCFLPLFVAFDIFTSRIYDFRHDYYDVYFGTVIGIFASVISFYYVYKDKSDDEEPNSILPL